MTWETSFILGLTISTLFLLPLFSVALASISHYRFVKDLTLEEIYVLLDKPPYSYLYMSSDYAKSEIAEYPNCEQALYGKILQALFLSLGGVVLLLYSHRNWVFLSGKILSIFSVNYIIIVVIAWNMGRILVYFSR